MPSCSVRPHFSFLRGASSAEELFAQAAILGIEAMAVADRNSLAGIVRAHEAAKATGTRLIVGCRLDLAAACRCWRTFVARPAGRGLASPPRRIGIVPAKTGILAVAQSHWRERLYRILPKAMRRWLSGPTGRSERSFRNVAMVVGVLTGLLFLAAAIVLSSPGVPGPPADAASGAL